MSVVAMMKLAVARQAEEERGRSSASPRKTVDGALESPIQKITAFIPSEIIGIYVAGFGILSPESAVGKWWSFGICLALIPVFTFLSYLEQLKYGGEVKHTTILIVFAFAAIAFVAWAAALPGTPFLAITPNATRIGGFSVVILAAVMYKTANLIGIAPKQP
jgi:hypothetical protein